jgi:flagellar L-ring protein precursor FlgH
MKLARSALGLAMIFSVIGCSRVHHIKPYKKKARAYKHDTYASPDAARTPGSLWSEGAHNLFEETRARRVGDILTVNLAERADATRDTATATQRQSSAQVGVSAVIDAMHHYAAQHPGFDPNAILAGMSTSAFNSQGGTSRSGQLDAILPVRIKEQLPNGDFYVEGSKMLLLNNEESTLYLSGVVRLIDINTDNSVDSGKLADVELEYTGRGVLADNENPGWLSRMLGWVWPF